MKRGSLLSVFLGLGMLLPALAFAHGGGACKADREKYCSNVKGDFKAVHQCMKDHANDLSAECKTQIEQGRARHEAMRQACKEDKKRLCGTARGKEAWECMQTHQSELSESCKAQLPPPRS
ncbi:MAG: hypothetical protein U1F57_07835 [bacterium]